MKAGKRTIILCMICLIFVVLLGACGKKTEKPLVEQIDEQLAGTWISYDSDKVISKWTFYDGNYVCDTYVDGKKLDNSSVGTYSIGSEAIHTITADQKRNVEGKIPFSFDNGKLELHGANGEVKKEK